MQWKVPTTVTVQISGEAAPKAAELENQTGEAAVTVSRRMRVLVSAPDNPDEFLITTEPDTQAEQYVPDDGPTTWNYSVTPRYTTSTAKVVIRAWIVYDANTKRELPVYQKVVMVKVPGLGECLKRLVEGDPDYWLKYGLPGGSGFIFLSGLVAGIWKWRAKRRNPKS
jgi:hypothetical protein